MNVQSKRRECLYVCIYVQTLESIKLDQLGTCRKGWDHLGRRASQIDSARDCGIHKYVCVLGDMESIMCASALVTCL